MNDMDNNTDVIKQKGFHYNWEGNPEKTSASPDGYYPMRGWQSRAYELLKTNPFMIVNAPMGSGKSWLICLLSYFKLKQDKSLRCVITVPQTIIAPGFTEAKFRMPDGEKIDWKVKHNLCVKNRSQKGTVSSFIDWLLNPLSDFSDRVILCTHATLVKAYEELKSTNRLDFFNNLLIWIDEAHHIKNSVNEDLQGVVISNGLGELVLYCSNKSSGLQVGLTTASFFRGDRCTLLTREMESKFIRFNLPYDEYLRSMTYLRSFNFDFLICSPDYAKAIELLLKNKSTKDIIYVPHPISQSSTGDKYREVERIISAFTNVYNGTVGETPEGVTIIQQADNDFKILDLVNENKRPEKKNFINDNRLKIERQALDCIIALGMFKEGANWIWAERSIIVGARSSLVDVIQMIGRLFRDAPGKSHVEVIQLLPFSLEQQDDEKFRNNLNNYLKAIYASLILENIFNPVKIRMAIEKKRDDANNTDFQKNHDWLSAAIPDEAQKESLVEDARNCLINLTTDDPRLATDISRLWEEYQRKIPSILQEYGVVEHKEEIAKEIWGMFARRTLLLQGNSVEDIDFNILQKTNPLEFLIRYTSGVCNIDTFEKLREAIKTYNDESDSRWHTNYNLTLEYTTKKGNCKIPKDLEVLNDKGKLIKLGSWFNDQKKNFYSLAKEKQDLLYQLPGFIEKKFVRNKSLTIDQWIDLFIRASKKEKTSLLPNTHIEEGFSLGAWMQYIRKVEEWNKLTNEQRQRLLDNNFKLSPLREREEASVLAMKQFALREGTTVPKSGHKEEIFHKGENYEIRLDNFRNKVIKNPQAIEQVCLDQLKKIPNFMEQLIDTKENRKEHLDAGLNYYRKFVNLTGKTIIEKGDSIEGFDLFDWNKKVRSNRMLDNAFRAEILSIDPRFFSNYKIRIFFQDLYPKIELYIQQNGHAIIPQNYICPDGTFLGEKISNLREQKDKLEQPIYDYLNSLGHNWAWNYFEYVHIQNAKQIISFLETDFVPGKELPKMIRELRIKVRNVISKYPAAQHYIERISEIAPNFFLEKEELNFLALLKYLEREGHACPPIKHIEDGRKIGLHVSNIRQKYKENRMTNEEKMKYGALHGWRWDASDLQSSTIRKKVFDENGQKL